MSCSPEPVERVRAQVRATVFAERLKLAVILRDAAKDLAVLCSTHGNDGDIATKLSEVKRLRKLIAALS